MGSSWPGSSEVVSEPMMLARFSHVHVRNHQSLAHYVLLPTAFHHTDFVLFMFIFFYQMALGLPVHFVLLVCH